VFVSLIVEEPEMLTDPLGVSLNEPLSLIEREVVIERVSLCERLTLLDGETL